jgi:hypothetical protein
MAAKQVTSRTLVLAALAVTAAVVLVAIWPRGTADTTGSAPELPRDVAAPGGQADPAVPPALGLERMEAQRAVPANRRDLFRFGAAQPAPAPDAEPQGPADGQVRPPAGRRGVPVQPDPGVALDPTPPPPPPIPLRYVGYADNPGSGRIAALSDGRFTYNGKEGDVIEGKWRIVRIGVESIVIEYVNGTGRQTLRLAGG